MTTGQLKTLDSLAQHSDVYKYARRIAIIDLGSNSFRLIVVEYVPGLSFKITDEVRESVRLSEGMAQTGIMRAGAMERAARAISIYAAFCKASAISEIIAAGTSAIREAQNSARFLARLERETGIRVRVLSGQEEAYYGYLAAVNSTTLTDGFVLDLGGGSLEITRVAGREMHESVSLPLGTVNVTEAYLQDDPPAPKDLKKLQKDLHEQFTQYEWLRARDDSTLIGEGGTLRLIGRLAQKLAGYPLDNLHGYTVSLEQVEKVCELLAARSTGERKKLPGMKADRADISLAGAVVVLEAMRAGGFRQMTICSQGMREGLFYEHFLSSEPGDTPLFADVRRASVLNLAHLYRFQEQHAGHIAHLTLSMFDQLPEKCTVCGPPERELLWAASVLHDIGVSVDYHDHHKHSYYLILNAGLPGYTHRETALIALMARYHRKGTPDPGELSPLLAPGDEQKLQQLSALLRLAEQLDRSRDGVVQDIILNGSDDWLQIELIVRGDGSVALWAVETQRSFFEQAFGLKLEFALTAAPD